MTPGDDTARRIPRKDRTGANAFLVGATVLAIAVIATYLGFSKHIPFTHGFRVKAVVPSANSLRKNSPVRIAGVNVGKVKAISRAEGSDAAVITLELQDKALPIHKDASVAIRPRIFLEGNFFVDLKPGTPQSPTLSDGDSLSMANSTSPVQFGDLLTALQSDTRARLKDLLHDYGGALTDKPTAADDATRDPSMRGLTGARALNRSLDHSGAALKYAAIVNDALTGSQPHDVSNLVQGLGRVTKALDTNEGALQGLIVNLDTTLAALAARKADVRATIRELAPTLTQTTTTLRHLDASLPATRAFAKDILPGVRATAGTIAAGFPWIRQTRGLLSANELRGVAQELSPAVGNLASVAKTGLQLFPEGDLAARCATDVLLPSGDQKIQDGSLSTNAENYKEFWYTMVGLSGETQNFDGNGQYVRFQPGGGDQSVSTGQVGGSAFNTLYGNAATRPLGTRPAYPGKRPPYRPDVPCYTQKLPNLNGAAVGRADGGGSSAVAQRAIARQHRASANAPARVQLQPGSVAAQLLDTLNPFRRPQGARP